MVGSVFVELEKVKTPFLGRSTLLFYGRASLYSFYRTENPENYTFMILLVKKSTIKVRKNNLVIVTNLAIKNYRNIFSHQNFLT